jgi:hypothetical protein
LDSESQAAKKFGCGTTRFKTMWVISCSFALFFCMWTDVVCAYPLINFVFVARLLY